MAFIFTDAISSGVCHAGMLVAGIHRIYPLMSEPVMPARSKRASSGFFLFTDAIWSGVCHAGVLVAGIQDIHLE